jgi:hypothetical protein
MGRRRMQVTPFILLRLAEWDRLQKCKEDERKKALRKQFSEYTEDFIAYGVAGKLDREFQRPPLMDVVKPCKEEMATRTESYIRSLNRHIRKTANLDDLEAGPQLLWDQLVRIYEENPPKDPR